MFSTSTKSIINNGNPFPIPSFLGQDNGDYIFSHQDLNTAAHFFPAAAINNAPPPVLKNTNNGKKPAAHLNKDNHSKIVTAHGPRDRRVRLSIQIAREFFDLQDTLGFDRASKTLEWLLTKSKSSIEELVNTKHSSRGKNISETSEIGEKSKRKPLIMSRKHQKDSNFPLLARELRAKARERARERTKKKMFIRFLNESEKLVPDFSSPVQNYQRNLINSKQVSLYYSHGIGNWDISNSFPQASPSTADFQNCGKQLWGGVKLPDYE